ncbi:MAG: hypothetical protein JWN46_1528 [Acidimicrobiales bacterium]|nr:hypothetical protein [Acidimicrobiales bacterium]
MTGSEPTAWAPSHWTPPDGVPAWPAPDPTALPAQPLDGHIQVMLLARGVAGWCKVRCSNGWETWVDERQLVPLPAPASAAVGAEADAVSTAATPGAPAVPAAPETMTPAVLPAVPGAPPVPAAPETAPPVVPPASPRALWAPPFPGAPAGATVPVAARRRGPQPLVIALFVLIVLAIAGIVIAVASRSTGPSAQPAASSAGSTVPRVPTLRPSLTAPAGWLTSADGSTAARDQADLASADPSGPRARLLADVAAPTVASIKAAFAHPTPFSLSDPASTAVSGRTAVAISTAEILPSGATVVRRYVTVRTGPGSAALFILEDLLANFDKDKATLAAIPTVQ